MEDLSLHILDIVENSITAGAKKIKINIIEDLKKDLMEITIKDDGKGINKEIIDKILGPFVTTRTTRNVGLGLSLFAEAARQAGGDIIIKSEPMKGTTVKATFQHSHIDRKPLGNITDTLVSLIIGNPEVDFYYFHKCNGRTFSFDTKEIKTTLDGIPIYHPEIIRFIREELKKGISEIRKNIF